VLAVVLAAVLSVVDVALLVVDVVVEEVDVVVEVPDVDDEGPENKKGAACFALPLRLAVPTLSTGQPVGSHAIWEQHPRNGGEESRQVYQRNPGSKHSCARIWSYASGLNDAGRISSSGQRPSLVEHGSMVQHPTK
jgi:hypothetical protein